MAVGRMLEFALTVMAIPGTPDDESHDRSFPCLIAENSIFLSRTVLLESGWVLRARSRKTRSELLDFFTALLETGNTVIEDAEAVSQPCTALVCAGC